MSSLSTAHSISTILLRHKTPELPHNEGRPSLVAPLLIVSEVAQKIFAQTFWVKYCFRYPGIICESFLYLLLLLGIVFDTCVWCGLTLKGAKAPKELKIAFDPDRAKRRVLYPEVMEIFKDYTVYIGGSSSFDIVGKQYNKYDATMEYAQMHGYTKEQVLFLG